VPEQSQTTPQTASYHRSFIGTNNYPRRTVHVIADFMESKLADIGMCTHNPGRYRVRHDGHNKVPVC
jgi:hypothetical protein